MADNIDSPGLPVYEALLEKAHKEFAEDGTITEYSLVDNNNEWRYYFVRCKYDAKKAEYSGRLPAAVSQLEVVLEQRRQQAERFAKENGWKPPKETR